MPEPRGFCDLHCHLLYGVDDGAKTLEDSLEMARALVELGFTQVAPSPHARPEYAPREQTEARLGEVRQALKSANIPLELAPNAENFLLDEHLFERLGTPEARLLGAGGYLLVEAPYTAPVTALPQMVFRMKLKGITPLIAHPERCLEFERPGRAAEAVKAGALLQLDIGALTGRYGGTAKKVARAILDDGLYAVGATDLHSPVGAREWVGKALEELKGRAGEQEFLALMRDRPLRILRGESLES
jgi:protein-tyrosine phosphatase